MKQQLQHGIRWVHSRIARKPVPEKLAMIFHELEAHQRPAFKDAMQYFKDKGYRFVGADEFVGQCRQSDNQRDDQSGGQEAGQEGEHRDRQLFVSFDDNYASWHESLPLFDDLGLKATFYTNTQPLRDDASASDLAAYFKLIDFHGERVTLSQAQLREMAAAGHDIGSHTHSHFSLTDLPRDQWEDEILGNRARLEDILSQSIDSFAYPYGMRRHLPDAVRDYCLDNGFKTIAYGIPGWQHTADALPYAINRSGWRFDRGFAYSLENIQIDGRLFETLTGRSAIG